MKKSEKGLLRKYGRYIAHMRCEIEDQRFGMVWGAGVSIPLNFPSWSNLVTQIAAHHLVRGSHIIKNSGNLPDTSKTQMLFHHYRERQLEKIGKVPNAKLERKIQGEWRSIIRDCLYSNVPKTAQELKENHPYLRDFLPVVRKTAMVVNYNFDDTLQRLLILDSKVGTAERSFETVWNAFLPFKANSTILYHPNGFLPNNLLEYPSDTLIFSEESFADQLIESMAGHHASLLHHFSKRTCLFIGLSLNDPTLRHLLRQGAVINPGHYHYHIHYIPDDATRNLSAEKALCEANFEVHNLITLFLTNDEIAALGRLLSMPYELLEREAEEQGVYLKQFYYLTGSIGAGKTTCLSYMGGFKVHDEWVEERPEPLGRPWNKLSKKDRELVDDWVLRQFYLKNYILTEQKKGIHIIDRSPLDPISFTELKNTPTKAKNIRIKLSPGKSSRAPQNGHIILLTGEPNEMETRVISRHKSSDAQTIKGIQENLQRIFDGHLITEISTEGLSISEVVKRVSREILLNEYKPVELATILINIEKNGLKV